MKRLNTRTIYGFTLIELLIVVAIIAILAAIAVPNFLEAQTRAKVSRVKADFRTIATGLETYHIDTNKYPWCNGNNLCLKIKTGNGQKMTLERLTTPIAYLTGKGNYFEPFKANSYWEGPTLSTKTPLPAASDVEKDISRLYWYTARNAKDSAVWDQTSAQDVDPFWWFMQSAGPDGTYDFVWQMINQWSFDSPAFRGQAGKTIYDATNGTTSRGSIFRVGGQPTGYGISFARMIEGAQ